MKFPKCGPWLVACLLSGLTGYWLGDSNQATTGAVDKDDSRRQPPQERRTGQLSGGRDHLVASGLRELLGDAPVSDSSIRRVTMRILEENDPVRRAAAISLILDSMTPSNAAQIRQAFIDITADTGRTHLAEWELMVRKFGVTLGQAALDEIKDNPNETALALEGWAMADPGEALKYFRTLDPKEHRDYEKRFMAMLAGVARTDPEMGFRLAMTEPGLPVDAGALLRSSIQSAGMEGATRALQNVIDSLDPDAARNPNFEAIARNIADGMIFQSWTSGRSENALPWLEQQKGQPFLHQDTVNHAAKNVALQGKLDIALDWMDRMEEGTTATCRMPGGVGMAVIENPSLLAQVDEATLGRVISQFPSGSGELKYLANAIEPLKPEYADRLRNAARPP